MPEDFSINSTVFLSRIHHTPANSLDFPNPNAPAGRDEIVKAVKQWLPAPPTGNTTGDGGVPGSVEGNQTFAQWCYASQVFQSMVSALSTLGLKLRGVDCSRDLIDHRSGDCLVQMGSRQG